MVRIVGGDELCWPEVGGFVRGLGGDVGKSSLGGGPTGGYRRSGGVLSRRLWSYGGWQRNGLAGA